MKPLRVIKNVCFKFISFEHFWNMKKWYHLFAPCSSLKAVDSRRVVGHLFVAKKYIELREVEKNNQADS